MSDIGIQTLQRVAKELSEKTKLLNGNNENKGEEMEKLRLLAETSKKNYVVIEKKYHQAKETMNQLSSENKDLKKESTHLQEKVQLMEKEILAAKELCAKIEDEKKSIQRKGERTLTSLLQEMMNKDLATKKLIDENEVKMLAMEQDITSKNKQIQMLQTSTGETISINEKMKILKKNLEESEKKWKEANEKATTHQNRLSNLEQNQKKKDQNVKSLVEQCESRLKTQAAALKKKECDIENLRSEISRKNHEIAELKLHSAQKLESIQNKANEKIQALSKLLHQNQQATSAERSSLVREEKNQILQQESQMDKRKVEEICENSHNRIKELEKTLKLKEEEMKTLNDDEEKYRDHCEKRMAKLKDEIGKKEKENASLLEEIKIYQGKYRIAKENGDLLVLNETSSFDTQAQAREIEEKKEQIHQLKDLELSLRQSLSNKDEKILSLIKTIEASKVQITQLKQNSLDEAEKNKNKQKLKDDNHKGEVEGLRQKIDQLIKNSIEAKKSQVESDNSHRKELESLHNQLSTFMQNKTKQQREQSIKEELLRQEIEELRKEIHNARASAVTSIELSKPNTIIKSNNTYEMRLHNSAKTLELMKEVQLEALKHFRYLESNLISQLTNIEEAKETIYFNLNDRAEENILILTKEEGDKERDHPNSCHRDEKDSVIVQKELEEAFDEEFGLKLGADVRKDIHEQLSQSETLRDFEMGQQYQDRNEICLKEALSHDMKERQEEEDMYYSQREHHQAQRSNQQQSVSDNVLNSRAQEQQQYQHRMESITKSNKKMRLSTTVANSPRKKLISNSNSEVDWKKSAHELVALSSPSFKSPRCKVMRKEDVNDRSLAVLQNGGSSSPWKKSTPRKAVRFNLYDDKENHGSLFNDSDGWVLKT